MQRRTRGAAAKHSTSATATGASSVRSVPSSGGIAAASTTKASAIAASTRSSHVLAPDGADGWQGGDVIEERSPLSGGGALRVGSDGRATSPAMCVTLLHPTLRFLARNADGPTGTLGVEVLFEDLAGRRKSLPIGVVAGGDSWTPTLPMPIVANLLALLPGGQTPVAFRFTARGGDWRIDDVYVDPYCKR
jgi:hypothetical protein